VFSVDAPAAAEMPLVVSVDCTTVHKVDHNEQRWRRRKEQVLKQPRLAGDWPALRQRVRAFLDQFTTGGSTAGHALLQYVGLLGEGTVAQACRAA
jgi:hypothetical protein